MDCSCLPQKYLYHNDENYRRAAIFFIIWLWALVNIMLKFLNFVSYRTTRPFASSKLLLTNLSECPGYDYTRWLFITVKSGCNWIRIFQPTTQAKTDAQLLYSSLWHNKPAARVLKKMELQPGAQQQDWCAISFNTIKRCTCRCPRPVFGNSIRHAVSPVIFPRPRSSSTDLHNES